MMSANEDDDEYSDFTTEEHRAVQLLGDELVRVVRRFHERHPTIYVDLRMDTSRWQRPEQQTFFELLPRLSP